MRSAAIAPYAAAAEPGADAILAGPNVMQLPPAAARRGGADAGVLHKDPPIASPGVYPPADDADRTRRAADQNDDDAAAPRQDVAEGRDIDMGDLAQDS